VFCNLNPDGLGTALRPEVVEVTETGINMSRRTYIPTMLCIVHTEHPEGAKLS
jgi:hypothetical protein